MKLREWLALRGGSYVRGRATALLSRYGMSPSKVADRMEGCVAMLTEHDCAPTIPTPGRVVERHPQLIRHLQDAGAEIAVHGYGHMDLRAYTPAEASEQLVRGAEAFSRHGIEVRGFRCPYLSCTDAMLDALPSGVFDYSSNSAVFWSGAAAPTDTQVAAAHVDVLHRLYRPTPALETVCVPSTRSNVVEIPVCLPDDLQLCDGLRLGPEGVEEAWSQILHRTHRRGGLFALLFHAELAWLCQGPLASVIREAKRLQPAVWTARLCDISSWWREKSNFAVAVTHTPAGLHLSFSCSEQATILVRGLAARGLDRVWDETYYQLSTRALDVPAEPRPFVGLSADVAKQVAPFLREQGYILDAGETSTHCGTYIDANTLAGLTDKVKLINYIEASTGPLVRYWRWPGGAKSAMCVTGDLDALTLLDYASRLFVS